VLIKEIELNNFRIYKGKNTINLLPVDDKNIIIISGKNGYGKTTFLMSLVWCLYGKQMDKVDELYRQEIASNENYNKYIGKSLNRLAQLEDETQFSVSVTFTNVKIPDITCNEIKITRSFDTKTGSSDKVEILIDGYINELTQNLSDDNQSGEEVFIRDFILPLEIAKFFFFDAEKIVSLAEVNLPEQRRALSKAYAEVLGIHKYEELKDRLEGIQYTYRKSVANSKEREAYIDTDAKIKKTELEMENLDMEITKLRRKEDEKKHQSSKIQDTLIRDSGSMTTEQLDLLQKEKEALEIKYNGLKNGLKDFLDLIPFALAGETLLAVSEQAKIEQQQKQNISKKQAIDDKTDDILQELENEKLKSKLVIDRRVRDFYEDQFKNLIKKYFYTDVLDIPEDIRFLHDFSDNQVNQFHDVLTTIRFSFKEKFSAFYNDNIQLKTKISSMERKINKALTNSEEQHIKELREKKELLDLRIKELGVEIENKIERKGFLIFELTRLRAERSKLKTKIEVADTNKLKDEKLDALIKIIKKFIVDFKEDKKRSLATSIKDKLSLLMHKKDFIHSVIVDIFEDDINIELRNKNDQKIDKSSLSMGERQMYASALLNSLASESNIEFPVFIDSPMQKFDQDHAKNMLKSFYPNVSSQVIIFPLIHKELTEDEYQLIKKNVSKSYIIENVNNDSSRFVEVKNENLIEEYNKRYVISN
jgi:DNA sulfur modification protein DndD